MRKHHHMKAPARIMNKRSKHREASRRIVIRLPFFDSYPVFRQCFDRAIKHEQESPAFHSRQPLNIFRNLQSPDERSSKQMLYFVPCTSRRLLLSRILLMKANPISSPAGLRKPGLKLASFEMRKQSSKVAPLTAAGII